MSDKENKTLPVALLVVGIICIMIMSCCFVWLVVRCERWRRRRKYRPKSANRYKINASHIANGEELKDLAPRNLKPSVNLIHYSSRHSVTSQSIPSLLSADSMDDSIASEPLYRSYGEDQPDDSDYLPGRDLSIARILGSFPELPFYPPSASNSVENVGDAKHDNTRPAPPPAIPIARPRFSVTPAGGGGGSTKPKEYSINSSLYTDCNLTRSVSRISEESISKQGDTGSTKSASSAEDLKVELPGGMLKIKDISSNFEFTRVRRPKKGNATTTSSSLNATSASEDKVPFETEV